MPSLKELLKRFLILLLLPWLVSACSSDDRKIEPPGVLLKRSIKEMKAENYDEAAKNLQQLLEDSPDSKERVIAQLLLGDAYYKSQQYEEAKFSYNQFIELYPAHAQAPRAAYYKAMADFDQVDIASRDQTFTHNALEEFEKLIETYPKSKYKRLAELRKTECEENLARNLLEIGKFYYRTNAYQSAISRLRNLMEDYPKQSFVDEALFIMAESYYEEQNYEDAGELYKRLLREHPRSEFTHDARERLMEKH